MIQSLFGLAVLTLLAWCFSEGRGRVKWRPVAIGLVFQIALGALLLKLPGSQTFFLWLNDGVRALDEATTAGTSFVFGYLGGGALPYAETQPGASFILAFKALPLVLVISALSALLFHWRVLPATVRLFSKLLQRTLGIGGAVGVGAAANVFIGMVESPLLIRPYLKSLSRSELFMVMTCGMATIAGTVLALYAMILSAAIPDAVGHILTASLISAPAAITVARLMVPDDGNRTSGKLTGAGQYHSSMDAVTKGTIEGLTLLLNIVAMLVVLVALVSLANQMLGLLPGIGEEPVTLERLLGYIMSPICWLMGVSWSEATTAGALMGTKTILNEFIAYLNLAALPGDALSEKSRLIMTYAMCGFANFGSLGIMVGGMGAMASERRGEIVQLGLKTLVSGTLATCMTGAVAGIILSL